MKLVDNVTFSVIELNDNLLWSDEFSWSPVVSSSEYTTTGALVIQSGVRVKGRPFTLEGSDDSGWLPRSTVTDLIAWAAVPNKTMTLHFEYNGDSRTFNVMFDTTKTAVEAKPAKGFPSPLPTDPFKVTIRLMEI